MDLIVLSLLFLICWITYAIVNSILGERVCFDLWQRELLLCENWTNCRFIFFAKIHQKLKIFFFFFIIIIFTIIVITVIGFITLPIITLGIFFTFFFFFSHWNIMRISDLLRENLIHLVHVILFACNIQKFFYILVIIIIIIIFLYFIIIIIIKIVRKLKEDLVKRSRTGLRSIVYYSQILFRRICCIKCKILDLIAEILLFLLFLLLLIWIFIFFE